MKAMILAAGRGERLRPLTDRTPKPLIEVGGKPLVAWHLERLARSGLRDVVINVSHLAEMIEARLGDGSAWGVSIAYSREAEALETAGGIATARELLGAEPFLLVNADVYCDVDFTALSARDLGAHLAHLVLVPNPGFRPEGDFSLAHGSVGIDAAPRYTYAGIALIAPRLVAHVAPGRKAPLGPVLRDAASRGEVSGEVHHGAWSDVGTPQRLAELAATLNSEERST
ncbi:MAG: N-acetylmuramate alpha-1-phosphate uridylyltransferase MurU [Burkholderiales bacterium]